MTNSHTSRIHVKQIGGHNFSGIFIFLLIGAFAIFSMLLVLVGVQAYRSVVDTSDVNGNIRTSISYVANKIRASDGSIAVKQMDGVSVLTIHQKADEDVYETRIYFLPFEDNPQSGALYEQVVEISEPFEPDLGEMISEVKEFRIEQLQDIVRLNVVAKNDDAYRMDMRLRAENLAP